MRSLFALLVTAPASVVPRQQRIVSNPVQHGFTAFPHVLALATEEIAMHLDTSMTPVVTQTTRNSPTGAHEMAGLQFWITMVSSATLGLEPATSAVIDLIRTKCHTP